MNEMNDFANMLIGIADGLKNPYESRKIARNYVDGLEVSTINSADCGPETAIIDADKVRIVERYKTIEDAKIGHAKWVEQAKTLESVVDIGYGTTIGPETYKLRRKRTN